MPSLPALLITGCSTGIGREAALYLGRRGYLVYAGVRREESFHELKEGKHPGVVPVLLDVQDQERIQSAFLTIEHSLKEHKDVASFSIVNNAGLGFGFPAEIQPEEALAEIMDVNFFGSVRVTRAFLPLVRTYSGKIIFITSINGKLALPMMSAYAASKFATEAYADALRRELLLFGKIPVVVVEPGAVKTPIFSRADERARALLRELSHPQKGLYEPVVPLLEKAVALSLSQASSPLKVARTLEKILKKRFPAPRYRVGSDAHFQYLFSRLPDRLLDTLIVMGFRMLARFSPSPPEGT